MSLTLTADIAATDRVLEVTGTVPVEVVEGYAFRLDDELLVVTSFVRHEVQYPGWTQMDHDPNMWMVRRGQGGSVAATHDAGATVKGASDAYVSGASETTPGVFAPGGGSALEVLDEGVSLDAAVTSLDFTGSGVTATNVGHAVTVDIPGGGASGFIVSATDPGAVGAGVVWKDISGGAGTGVIWRERNDADDGWDATAVVRVLVAADGIANANSVAVVGANGEAFCRPTAEVDGDGNANAGSDATIFGSGAAYAGPVATALGTGTANAMATAISPSGTTSFGPIADANRADIQCNGVTLYTEAAAAPTVFASLFYRDTTAVTGRMYMWDFITAAYVPISPVF